ncbi:MAG: ROK family protein [Roseburia sp.]|nr:ROK family protein [Anaeroplasma bactoclasticum]MCM1195613.1 ROK family protein [Roseburia sp.]MCM1556203.1 ROK family protein [Anaeroplasma bactoclasticum]
MYNFGIDIGGTSIKIGFFSEAGELLEQWEILTHSANLFVELASSIKTFLKQKGIDITSIYGYGIGVPGIVKNGIAVKCVNLGWEEVDVASQFSKALGHKVNVFVFNDANIAAYGEKIVQKLNGSIVFITLGTGVGGGIILNDEILEGNSGLCGEIGHMYIDSTYSFTCGCGNKGHLETISSATGLCNLARHYQNKLPSKLVINDKMTAKDIIDAAKREDPLAIYVVDEACKYLARALATIAVIVNPDAFIIGGGLSNAGAFLIDKIKSEYKKICLKQAMQIKIKLAVLKNDAGIFGAAAYIMKKKQEVKRNG